MKEYLLVNPIVSSTESIFKGSNSLEAAENAYKELSKQFSNVVKNFKFTLLKLDKNNTSKLDERNNKDFYHFNVNERNREEGKDVEFLIQPIKDDKIVLLDEFKKRAYKTMRKNITMKKNKKSYSSKGGKSKYRQIEDDSDSSDSSDYYVKKPKFNDLDTYNYNYNWWYNPFLYVADSFYIPNFVNPYYYYTLDFKLVNLLNNNNNVTISHNS